MTALFFESDVPKYLHASPHYQEIVRDEAFPACGLEFPVGCVKKDMRVESLTDLVALLQTLRYWLLPDLVENSAELVQFCLEHAHLPCVYGAFREFAKDFPYLNDLLSVSKTASSQQLYAAIRLNRLSIVKYLHETSHTVDEKAGLIAVASGHLECLRYIHSVGLPLTYIFVADSIIHGQLPVLQYLLDQGAKLHSAAFVLCACYGRLDCMIYLMERKCPVDKMFTLTEAFFLASEKGHIDCIKYMWKNCDRSGDICYEKYILRGATEGQQLEVFKFAVENNFPIAYYHTYLQ
eukprot:gene32003-36130_t